MKILLKLSAVFLLVVVMFSTLSCDRVDDGPFVEPITLYERIQGDWLLSDIIQVDETRRVANINPQEISLINVFDFDTFGISFEVDANNRPTSYRVIGIAPELFPNTGFWGMEHSFPQTDGTAPVINLYSDAARANRTAQLRVAVTPGARPEMELVLTRRTGGVAFVSYRYRLFSLNLED